MSTHSRTPNLRHLTVDTGRSASDGPADVFEAARKHETVRPILVGVQTSTLHLATPEERIVLGELASKGRPPALEMCLSPGTVPEWLHVGPPAFDIERDAAGNLVAHSKSDESEQWTALWQEERWEWAVDAQFGGDRARLEQLLEIEALRRWGSDLTITFDPALTEHRRHRIFDNYNLMTLSEAAVIIGVWSRVIHKAFVAGAMGMNNGLYYWSLARALTPAAWPGFAASLRLERYDAEDREVADLFGSVLDRLASLGRSLDRLVAVWQCSPNNDTTAELVDEFDRLVLGSWAIYDNLALLVGRYFRIRLEPLTRWGMLSKDWRKSVAAVADPRAAKVLAHVRAETHWLAVSEEVRHQLIHRARFTQMGDARGADSVIRIEGRTLERVEAALRNLGAELGDWGFELVLEGGPIRVVNVNDASDVYEFDRGREGWLRPTVFALRTVAHAARFTNRIIELLDLASDSRLEGESRSEAPSDPYFAPRGAAMAVLLSPLSGLVDQTLPLADERPRVKAGPRSRSHGD